MCVCCNKELVDGEDAYFIEGEWYCEDCISESKTTYEEPGPDIDLEIDEMIERRLGLYD